MKYFGYIETVACEMDIIVQTVFGSDTFHIIQKVNNKKILYVVMKIVIDT